MDIFFILKFLILVQIAIAESKKIQMQSRMYPGQTASEGTFFYQGYLSYNGEHYCSGTVIHHRWALTAAHCIKSADNPAFTVGTIYLYGSDGMTYGVQIFHPHIRRESKIGPPSISTYDIALIRTTSDIVYNDRVNFIPLARDTAANYIGQVGVMSGWGHSQYGHTLSSALLYEYVAVAPITDCQSAFRDWYWSDDLHLCLSGKGRQQMCPGDSGGPFVMNSELIGIASGSYKMCTGDAPSVYTKVSTFTPWVEGILADYGENL